MTPIAPDNQGPEAPILVVEDDTPVRDLVSRWLEEDGFVCRRASCAEAALVNLEKEKIPLVLSDIRMPGMDGLELLKHIRRNYPGTLVIMLTASDDLDYAWQARQLGAFGYILKPLTRIEILFNVNNALQIRGELLSTWQDGETHLQYGEERENIAVSAPYGPWELNLNSWSLVSPDQRRISLTAMELKLLNSLCETPGQPVDRNQLMAQLYPRQDAYSSKALNALVKRLRIKIMNETGMSPPLQTAHGVGYCFSDPVSIR